MKTRKSVEKNPVQSSSGKVKQSAHVSIEADTFSLQAHLNQKQLTIILKDYVSWKIYNKYCSEQGLSQEFDSEIKIEDIFSVFESDDKHPWIKKKLIHYKFGEILSRNNQRELIIKQNGKISLSIPSPKGKQSYELTLYKSSQINKRDQLKIHNEITKIQIEEDYDKQIVDLKTKNANLQKELQRVQYLLYMSEYMRARSVKKQNQGECSFQIFAKDLVGRTHTIDVKMNDTILKLKNLIQVKSGQCPDQQRLIYAGFQLQNQQTLASYYIRPESTIHIVLRLKGSIGIFNEYINSQYRELLLNKGYKLKQDEVRNLIHIVNGNSQSKFDLKQVSINSEKLSTLISYCNKCYLEKLTEQNLENIEDFKLNLSISQICQFIGEELFRQLEQMFNQDYNQIVMRRCQAYGKLIKFHTDAQQKTLQVSLNDDSEYVGGRLIFANGQGIHTPKRKAGTVTIHDNTIVHGVSLFESGTRYSLFLLKN